MHIKRLSSPRSVRPALWALLVLLFALAACGNDAPADEASVADEATVATAVVAPTEAVAEDAPAPTTAPEPTAAPATAPAEPTPTLAVVAETDALPAGDCATEFPHRQAHGQVGVSGKWRQKEVRREFVGSEAHAEDSEAASVAAGKFPGVPGFRSPLPLGEFPTKNAGVSGFAGRGLLTFTLTPRCNGPKIQPRTGTSRRRPRPG